MRDERLKVCQDCKFFKKSTGSCGTLIIGQTVELEENKVTHYKAKIKLCGCKMRWKAKYPFASCPAGKWNAYIYGLEKDPDMTATRYRDLIDSRRKVIKDFVLSLHGLPRLEQSQVRLLYSMAKEVSGNKSIPVTSSCGACVAEMLNTMTKVVNQME